MAEQAETTVPTTPQPAPAPAPKQSPEERIRALLDREAGGDPAPEPRKAAPPPDDGGDDDADTVTASEQDEAEAKAAPEAKADDGDDASDEGDGEEVAIESLADLAEHLGVDVADLYQIQIPVTNADGTAAQVTLSQWKDAYQASTTYTKRERELADARKKFDAESKQTMERLQSRLQEVDGVLGHAERQLAAEYQGINWQELRTENPAEYAARRSEFNERWQQIQAAKHAAHQHAEQMQREQQEARSKAAQELLQKEQEALLRALPEWRDDTKAAAGKKALVEYLRTAGFSAEEVGGIGDHRALLLARKAMLYDESQKQAKAAAKKVVKLGKKVMKPGPKPNPNDAKADELRSLKARVRKSGKTDDAAEALRKIMGR